MLQASRATHASCRFVARDPTARCCTGMPGARPSCFPPPTHDDELLAPPQATTSLCTLRGCEPVPLRPDPRHAVPRMGRRPPPDAPQFGWAFPTNT
eukprot:5261075-Alexandrium_andersonii.AAC.1